MNTEQIRAHRGATEQALKHLHDEVERYFGASKAGPSWPKFLDEAMYMAQAALAQPAQELLSIEDDPRLSRLMDSQYEAGRTAGWNAGLAHAEASLNEARRKFRLVCEGPTSQPYAPSQKEGEQG